MEGWARVSGEPVGHDGCRVDPRCVKPMGVAPDHAVADAGLVVVEERALAQKHGEATATSVVTLLQPAECAGTETDSVDPSRFFQLWQADADAVGFPQQKLTPPAQTSGTLAKRLATGTSAGREAGSAQRSTVRVRWGGAASDRGRATLRA